MVQRRDHHTKWRLLEKVKEPDSETAGAFAASKDSSQAGSWLVDSGASSHMTCDKELLTDYQEFEIPEKVGLDDGRTVDALGVGNVHFNMVFKVSQPKKSVMYKATTSKGNYSLRAGVSSNHSERQRC